MMFAYINGVITEKGRNHIVIEAGGVGFYCTAGAITIERAPKIGSEGRIYTYMSVREDAIELFGFADKDELRCFKQLISVSGVGPKAAVSVLSEVTADEFAIAVSAGDYKTLTRAAGVGPKLAQRIVLELKDKVASAALAGISESISLKAAGKDDEAASALMALGYSPSEAKSAVRSLNTADMSVEDIVRIALKTLMR